MFLRIVWKLCSVGVVAIGLVQAAPARAQSTQIEAGDSITYDGLTFTVTSCNYFVMDTIGTCGATGTEALNGLLKVVGMNGSPEVELVSAGPGPLISLTVPTNPNYFSFDDLTLGIRVSPASTPSRTGIFALSTAVVGSTLQASDNNKILVRTTFSAPSPYDLVAFVGGAPSAQSFAVTSPLNLTYDLRLNAAVGASPGDVLSLANVNLMYAVPEPGSIALIATGLCGVLATRRHFRRRTEARAAV